MATPPAQRPPQTAPAPFNEGQQAILQLLQHPLTDKQIGDIEQLIRTYLAGQTDEAANRAWDEKGMGQADMKKLLTTHMRTPYKQK